MVIAMRKDIKLSPGKMAAQAAHAAVSCAFASKKKQPLIFEKWYADGQRKIVVKIDSLKELYELKAVVEAMGLTSSLVCDAGLTEVPPGTVTCLGIGPGTSEVLDKVTGHLKLW